MLSLLVYKNEVNNKENCSFGSHGDMTTKSSSSIREAQMSDDNLSKTIICFEYNQRDENFINCADRRYLMNQSDLYRYAPDLDAEEAQLVIPSQEKRVS
ncbi:hypothetical protein CEXT_812861 [Caerostris extrusa]|uniref:Uncharacterized protein n=1 Tax=Caerostris extrusa TaxID=172846 RepID=A0AAV4NC79_CAEEX|nr:hypothetical protein CEXT_812861 [Caerostris extrusa]